MNKRSILAAGFLFLSATLAFGANKLDSTPYQNIQHGFQINPPEDWTIDESGQFGTLVFFFEPTQSGTNMNVVTEPTELPLDEYVALNQKGVTEVLTEYQPTIDQRITTADGKEAHLIGGSFLQGKTRLFNIQLLIVDGKKAFVVTGTTATWEKYKDIFNDSLLTFSQQ